MGEESGLRGPLCPSPSGTSMTQSVCMLSVGVLQHTKEHFSYMTGASIVMG